VETTIYIIDLCLFEIVTGESLRNQVEGLEMRKRRITKEEVEHVAWLAHIELSEEEKVTFTEQFNEILNYFEKIDETDTEDVPPTYHVLDLVNVYRGDEAKESITREDAFRNASKKENGFFKAPRIV